MCIVSPSQHKNKNNTYFMVSKINDPVHTIRPIRHTGLAPRLYRPTGTWWVVEWDYANFMVGDPPSLFREVGLTLIFRSWRIELLSKPGKGHGKVKAARVIMTKLYIKFWLVYTNLGSSTIYPWLASHLWNGSFTLFFLLKDLIVHFCTTGLK